MIINIIAVSKIREDYIAKGMEEYLKRLKPYCTVRIKEVEAEKVKSSIGIDKVKDLEATKITHQLTEGAYLIVLDENGKRFNSVKFAEYLENNILNPGIAQIDFVIGGANGLSKGIISKSDLTLSLSDLTFPHQLVRLIIIEQIYRAFRIIRNEPYHK